MAFCADREECEYLRIHIRANSNETVDQTVKYEVRDMIVAYLTPMIERSSSKEEAMNCIRSHLSEISALSDDVLRLNGFDYGARASLKRETFPTRVYDGVTLEAGEYDAVIVELGDGKGDNWWCVVYPPLCFSGEKVHYKSYLYGLVKKYIGG
ncbi:MAG: stage II sporulation protein R [Clostridia bacterium]|nr:stage II sporulation protein R [Clostridia bacterium]